MPKLTPEKIRSIIGTFKKEKNYAETARIEDVDPRTVKSIIEKDGKKIGTRKEALNVDVQFAKSTSHTEPSDLEPEAFKLFQSGMNAVDIVVMLKVPSNEAIKMYTNFLKGSNLNRAVEIWKQAGDIGVDSLYSLHKAMCERNMDPVEFATSLSPGQELTRVHERLRQGQQALEKQQNDSLEIEKMTAENIRKLREQEARLRSEIGQLGGAVSQLKAERDDTKKEIDMAHKELRYIRSEEFSNMALQRISQLARSGDLVQVAIDIVLKTMRQNKETLLLVLSLDNNEVVRTGFSLEEYRRKIEYSARILYRSYYADIARLIMY